MAKSNFIGNESPLPSPKGRSGSGVDHSIPKVSGKGGIAGSGKDVFPPSKYEPSSVAKSAPSAKPEAGGKRNPPTFGQSA